jgi:hypothetical protein
MNIKKNWGEKGRNLKHMDFRHIWPRGTAQQYEPQVCILMRKTEYIKKTGKKMIHIWPRGTAKLLPTPELNLKVRQRRYRKAHPIRASRCIRQKGHRKEQTIGASKYSVLYHKKNWPRGTAKRTLQLNVGRNTS